MIIPWGTDAPIYHRPIATIGVIVGCLLSSLLLPHDAYDDWALELGAGLHPLQWVTNLFLHLGLCHLIGNMIFLWTFGLVVEGKLGWWGFLLVYLGIGVTENAAMQLLVHPAEPSYVLAASGVIFGLLAMCLVWAPKNEVQCIVWSSIHADGFRLPDPRVRRILRRFGSSCSLAFEASRLSSELAHVGGAVLGFGLAVLLLKLKLVDCENWDLFAVLEGRQGQSKAQAAKNEGGGAAGDGRVQGRPAQAETQGQGDRASRQVDRGSRCTRAADDASAPRAGRSRGRPGGLREVESHDARMAAPRAATGWT